MSETATLALTGPIAHLLERLVEMARLCMGMSPVNRFVATLAWGRMRRLEERFARLKARLEAGTLRPPRARRDAEARAGDAGRVRVRRPPLAFLPRTFGWFARLVPGAGPAAQECERLLAAPEMPALISVAPQAGRILRPLAHMLGVRRPMFLRLPRRKRPATPLGPSRGPSPRFAGEGEKRHAPHPPASQGGGEGKEVHDPPPAPPAPQRSRSPEEQAALAYARRPGGLYWDGTRFRWS